MLRDALLRNALHIAHGLTSLSDLRVDQLVARDSLSLGPCRVDPVAHARIRREYWIEFDRYHGSDSGSYRDSKRHKSIVSADDLARVLSEEPEDRELVFWSTPTWSDRLFLWWALDAIERIGVGQRSVSIGEPVEGSADPRRTDLKSVGHYPPDRLVAAFHSRRALNELEIAAGAALWRHYASSHPLAFDRARRRGVEAFPDLSSVAEAYAPHFPRARSPRDDRVLVSRFDAEWFFEDLRAVGSWASPIELMQKWGSQRMVRFIDHFGDRVIVVRLREWSRVRPEDPILLERERDGCNSLTRCEFRLADRGRRLLEEGTSDIADLPPTSVGGVEVTTPQATWVRVETAEGWRIQRWRPGSREK